MKYYWQLLFSFNKMIFQKINVENICFENINNNIDYCRIKNIDNADVNRILELGYPVSITAQGISDRLSRGDLLYVARDEEIISYLWLAVKKFYIEYLDGEISLDDIEFYEYGAFVDNKYRGQGIFNKLRNYSYGDMRKNGYRLAVTSYMSWNKNVERANKKFGYQEYGEVVYGYVLLFRYFINKMPKGKVRHLDSFLGKWKKLINR